ncbi:MAG: hypothetical protein ABEJ90_01675 [Halobacterium sp.]
MTSRRTFLGAAAAAAGLSATTGTASAAPEVTDEEIAVARGQSSYGGRDHTLPANGTNAHIERYDENGQVGLDVYPNDPHNCVGMYLVGEWGDAGVTFTADQARALASKLVEAADEWEANQ